MKTKSYVGYLSFMVMILITLPVFARTKMAQSEPSAAGEKRIEREVRHQLVMLPFLNVFDNLTYKVEGYNVTLGGQVTNPAVKSNAASAVKSIEGVEKINNQIEVLPPSPMDDRLRIRLYHAIYWFAPLQRYALPVLKPIRIIVKNGHVTLEGVVDNQADKDMAGLRAKSVPGIFSVMNNLTVAK